MILQTYNFTGCSLRWWEGCILERRAALHVSASQRLDKGSQQFRGSLPSGIGGPQGVEIQVVDRFIAGSHDDVQVVATACFSSDLDKYQSVDHSATIADSAFTACSQTMNSHRYRVGDCPK
jgi:hypothetical protein